MIYDLFVIGGGINGVGIARDAAGRGLSVYLAEQYDLASGTSSASTKLIHGGLRYLENYEFKLVRDALIEREILLKSAPHIISPMDFILPHHKDLRPYWLIRLGLFIYDNLGGREILKKSKSVKLKNTEFGKELDSSFTKGFMYSDCWADDARLVVLNAMDARDKGASVNTKTKCLSLEHEDGKWKVTVLNKNNEQEIIYAKMIANASGPWVDNVISKTKDKLNSRYKIKMVKGSHIIVPKLYEGDFAYIFQNRDNRIVFTIPYEGKFTAIGTTDVEYTGDPIDAKTSEDEKFYLIALVNEYFKKDIKKSDIIWDYSGIRPLVNDGNSNISEVTRDYVLDCKSYHNLPILSVYGGKLTSYRHLSEEAVDIISKQLNVIKPSWTKTAKLPGGNIGGVNINIYIKSLCQQIHWIDKEILSRYVRLYGTKVKDIIGKERSINALGTHFGEGIYQAEIDYLISQEFVLELDDILWRRTKLGLYLSEETIKNIDDYLRGM